MCKCFIDGLDYLKHVHRHENEVILAHVIELPENAHEASRSLTPAFFLSNLGLLLSSSQKILVCSASNAVARHHRSNVG